MKQGHTKGDYRAAAVTNKNNTDFRTPMILNVPRPFYSMAEISHLNPLMATVLDF